MKRALSALLLLALCFSLFSCGARDVDFASDSMKPYIRFKLSDLIGGSYTLTDNYGDLDAAAAERKFRDDRLNAATPLERKDQGSPAFGDAANLYYEIALTENGEGAFSNLYTDEGAQNLFIGYWEFLDGLPEDEYLPIFYNQALTEYVDNMTVIPHITEGVVEEGDKVRITYVRYDKNKMAVGTATNLRFDTAFPALYEEMGYPSFLLDSFVGKELGEEYEISGIETVKNQDGTTTEETFYYSVKPVYKVEETFETVAITVPDDAYAAEDGEALVALNGKTVYFRLMLESYYAFNTPDLSDEFLYSTYGFVTGEGDPVKRLEVATEKYIALAKERKEADLKSQALSQVMSKLLDNNGVRKYPKAKYNAYYEQIMQTLRERYMEASADATKNGQDIGMSFEEYSIYYLTYYGYYDSEQFSSLDEYVAVQVESKLDARILLLGAAELADLRLSRKEYLALFEEELQRSLEHEIALGNTTATREDLIASAGGEEEALMVTVLAYAEKAVADFIYANNTWTVTDGNGS